MRNTTSNSHPALRIISVLAVLVSILCVRPIWAQTSPAPAEIVELARALKYNPDLIYEYVYNNIETLPQYGSAKGPLGALIGFGRNGRGF